MLSVARLSFAKSAPAFGAVRACMSTVATDSAPAVVKRTKHKIPQKRASKLLHELRWEEFAALKNSRQFPDIKAGDSIQIEKAPYMTSKDVSIYKGVVIAKTNRASESYVLFANTEFGTPVIRRMHIYDPLIKDIKILQRAFIHKGLKRVRRSKIYYLLDRHPDNFTVK